MPDRVAPRTSPCGASGCRGDPAPRHGLSFFTRDAVAREETLNGSKAKGEALLGQRVTHLLDGGVPGGTQCRQDGIMVRFDAPGAAITAKGLGARFAFLPLPLPPPADARRADPKALTGFAVCCPSLHGGEDPDPEIE